MTGVFQALFTKLVAMIMASLVSVFPLLTVPTATPTATQLLFPGVSRPAVGDQSRFVVVSLSEYDPNEVTWGEEFERYYTNRLSLRVTLQDDDYIASHQALFAREQVEFPARIAHATGDAFTYAGYDPCSNLGGIARSQGSSIEPLPTAAVFAIGCSDWRGRAQDWFYDFWSGHIDISPVGDGQLKLVGCNGTMIIARDD